MKPTWQEVLYALADGKVIETLSCDYVCRDGKLYGRDEHNPEAELGWEELEYPLRTATRIIAPEPVRKEDPRRPETIERQKRQEAKDKLLMIVAYSVAELLNKTNSSLPDNAVSAPYVLMLIGKAFRNDYVYIPDLLEFLDKLEKENQPDNRQKAKDELLHEIAMQIAGCPFFLKEPEEMSRFWTMFEKAFPED